MEGYHGRPESLGESFLEGHVRSGDQGYLGRDGELYLLGRIKNLIIRGGEKYAPQDLERVANECEGITMSGAVGMPRLYAEGSHEESICLVLEVSRKLLEDQPSMQAKALAIGRACQAGSGIRPDAYWFVPANTLPFTANGKLRHQALRDMIESGALRPRFEFRSRSESVLAKTPQGAAP